MISAFTIHGFPAPSFSDFGLVFRDIFIFEILLPQRLMLCVGGPWAVSESIVNSKNRSRWTVPLMGPWILESKSFRSLLIQIRIHNNASYSFFFNIPVLKIFFLPGAKGFKEGGRYSRQCFGYVLY